VQQQQQRRLQILPKTSAGAAKNSRSRTAQWFSDNPLKNKVTSTEIIGVILSQNLVTHLMEEHCALAPGFQWRLLC
jgi:hypothetical protein